MTYPLPAPKPLKGRFYAGQIFPPTVRWNDDICGRHCQPRQHGISEINHVLKKIIEGYNVNYIISELPHGSQNASAARMIGMVAGICQTISDWTDIAIDWYSEGDAKKALLGKISATKKEIQTAVDAVYDVKWTGIKYKDEAIADALAIHFVAMEQSAVLKFWK